MAIWDFLTTTDQQGNKKADWSKLAPLLVTGASALTGNTGQLGNFMQSYQGTQNSMLDRKQQQEAQQKQQEYQDWLRKMQEEQYRQQQEQYQAGRFKMDQSAYDALNGSPMQQMFGPATTEEKYSDVPQEIQNYVAQMGVQIQPDKSRTITNWGEVSRDDYFKALADADARKKAEEEKKNNTLTWNDTLWKAVESSPLAVMYQPTKNEAGVMSWTTPTITKDEYFKLLQSKPQGMTEEDKMNLQLLDAKIKNTEADTYRTLHPLTGGGGNQEKSFVEQMDLSYQNFLKSHPLVRNSMGDVQYQPPAMLDWIRTTFGEETARKYAAESTGNQSLLNQPTDASKFGISSYKPSNLYSQNDWFTVDAIVKKNGSYQKTVQQLINDPNTTSAQLQALAARGGMSIQELQSKYNQNQQNQSTAWFKTHQTPPSGVSMQAWKDADWIIATSKGMGIKEVIADAAQKLKNGQLSQEVYNALVARSKTTDANNQSGINVSYTKNSNYSQEDWNNALQVVKETGGSPANALKLFAQQGKGTKYWETPLFKAMVDRYNQGAKTNWTAEQYYKKFLA